MQLLLNVLTFLLMIWCGLKDTEPISEFPTDGQIRADVVIFRPAWGPSEDWSILPDLETEWGRAMESYNRQCSGLQGDNRPTEAQERDYMWRSAGKSLSPWKAGVRLFERLRYLIASVYTRNWKKHIPRPRKDTCSERPENTLGPHLRQIPRQRSHAAY